jgi:hypothetical protein
MAGSPHRSDTSAIEVSANPQGVRFDRHCFDSSDASAFRTFDWEIPNCRAIRVGVMPALKAARTAFT